MKQLHEAFSLNSLKKIIEYVGKFYRLQQLVSLFVDRGVDEGIVVFTIYYSEEKHYARVIGEI